MSDSPGDTAKCLCFFLKAVKVMGRYSTAFRVRLMILIRAVVVVSRAN